MMGWLEQHHLTWLQEQLLPDALIWTSIWLARTMIILSRLRYGGHGKPSTYACRCACGDVVVITDTRGRIARSRKTGQPRRCVSCSLRGNQRRWRR
jgi:hypothetical protein